MCTNTWQPNSSVMGVARATERNSTLPHKKQMYKQSSSFYEEKWNFISYGSMEGDDTGSSKICEQPE